MRHDTRLLADIARGMIPRLFISSQSNDRVIYEEDQEVSEMYFVTKGLIGIAINNYGATGSFEIGRK